MARPSSAVIDGVTIALKCPRAYCGGFVEVRRDELGRPEGTCIACGRTQYASPPDTETLPEAASNIENSLRKGVDYAPPAFAVWPPLTSLTGYRVAKYIDHSGEQNLDYAPLEESA